MSEFALFEKLPTIPQSASFACMHSQHVVEHGIAMCFDCGSELSDRVEVSQPGDRPFFGLGHTADPTHCKSRKPSDRTIFGDVHTMDIDGPIVQTANNMYLSACKNKVHRGTYRRAIIFACVFHAYKAHGVPRSYESLIDMFEINRTKALKGLKFMNEHAPTNSPIRTRYITPADLIREFMEFFHARPEEQQSVMRVYDQVHNRSAMLNRSRPQSVAAGIIWFYVKNSGKRISMRDFTRKVKLSELTVNKIAKEVKRILQQ